MAFLHVRVDIVFLLAPIEIFYLRVCVEIIFLLALIEIASVEFVFPQALIEIAFLRVRAQDVTVEVAMVWGMVFFRVQVSLRFVEVIMFSIILHTC